MAAPNFGVVVVKALSVEPNLIAGMYFAVVLALPPTSSKPLLLWPKEVAEVPGSAMRSFGLLELDMWRLTLGLLVPRPKRPLESRRIRSVGAARSPVDVSNVKALAPVAVSVMRAFRFILLCRP